MRVLIVGVDDIGQRLVSDLSQDPGVELVVVDGDEKLCDQIAATYDALVICGDATDPSVLDEAQIQEADALVVTTGSDSVNTVVAILGVRRGVGRVIVKLVTPRLRIALEELGVASVILPAVAAAARIQVALHGESQGDLALLTSGALQVAELPIGAELDGTSVGELELPADTAPAGIARGEGAEVAAADAVLREGDVLLVVVQGEDAAAELEAQFRE